MIKRDPTGDRLVALFLLGAVLLLPPLLLVFDKPVLVGGVPLLYLHLFVSWAIVIGLAAAIVARIDAEAGPGAGAPVEPASEGDEPGGRAPP